METVAMVAESPNLNVEGLLVKQHRNRQATSKPMRRARSFSSFCSPDGLANGGTSDQKLILRIISYCHDDEDDDDKDEDDDEDDDDQQRDDR